MSTSYIPVSEPLILQADKDYVSKALSAGWVSGDGPYVEEFENAMCELTNRKYAISVSNGTVAIDLTIEALNLQAGDEVILPSFTIVSCLNQVLRQGATPVFVDSTPGTWNMDAQRVIEAITDKTRAIMVVHIYGLPVDLDPILDAVAEKDIIIIEDAAEAHGMTYKGKPCGSFGLVSTFSFYANKNITTGEGGMILTDDTDFANKIRNLKNLYFSKDRRFLNFKIGYNQRLSSIQCALGTSQLQRIDQIIERRIEIANYYKRGLDGVKGIQWQQQETDYAQNTHWVCGILLNSDLHIDASTIQAKLQDFGIGTRPFFFPLHKQPVLSEYGFENNQHLPISEHLGSHGFYIPNGLGIGFDKLDYVIKQLRNLLE